MIAEPDDGQDDWDAPIKEKPRSHKRKAQLTNVVINADTKKQIRRLTWMATRRNTLQQNLISKFERRI